MNTQEQFWTNNRHYQFKQRRSCNISLKSPLPQCLKFSPKAKVYIVLEIVYTQWTFSINQSSPDSVHVSPMHLSV